MQCKQSTNRTCHIRMTDLCTVTYLLFLFQAFFKIGNNCLILGLDLVQLFCLFLFITKLWHHLIQTLFQRLLLFRQLQCSTTVTASHDSQPKLQCHSSIKPNQHNVNIWRLPQPWQFIVPCEIYEATKFMVLKQSEVIGKICKWHQMC